MTLHPRENHQLVGRDSDEGSGDALLAMVAGSYLIAALAGLPLYADGGHYLFRIIVDGLPYVPDGRLAAVIPQLPAWLLVQLDASLVALRLAFSAGYLLLPFLSLLACWLIVRSSVPWLMVLPASGALLNQINASAVSELLAIVYLMWPLVLALSRYGERRIIRLLTWLAAPVMLTLHPVALLACVVLVVVVEMTIRDRLLSAWLVVCALARLLWSLQGLSGYEQSHLAGDGVLWYLLTQTLGQHAMLFAVTLVGLGVAVELLRSPVQGFSLAPRVAGALLVMAAVLVGFELILGQGWRLKSGITFPVQLLLMIISALSAPARGQRDRLRSRPGPGPGSRTSGAGARWAPVLRISLFGIAALMLVKSAAWWTATRGLQNVVSEPGDACVHHGRQTPFALQWPWMAVIDEWNAPMNALLFRPGFRAPGSETLAPIAILLPRDGCEQVATTGIAYLTPWLPVSWSLLDQRFGPLRALPSELPRSEPPLSELPLSEPQMPR
ncbi:MULTISPECIES: hypothetical protein [Thiorhodovibrio]|uniref:hypothetical protein n=1 Tax=Thiorhodovibrio TaxID=61593 RepID=UPI0019136F0F|nr:MULTISPECIES: hypothetical protein [Thiorhodovibrio]WPL11252.1 hypothetical protein Thiosp_00984 [Thiorhodovibrio litoralis]